MIISEAFGAVAALVEEKRLAASKKRNLVGKDRLRIGTAVVGGNVHMTSALRGEVSQLLIIGRGGGFDTYKGVQETSHIPAPSSDIVSMDKPCRVSLVKP